jgi:hypothetical protein
MNPGLAVLLSKRIDTIEKTIKNLNVDVKPLATTVESEFKMTPEIEKVLALQINTKVDTVMEENMNQLKKGLVNVVTMKLEQHIESKLKEISNSITDLRSVIEDIQKQVNEKPEEVVVQIEDEPKRIIKPKSTKKNTKTLDFTD